MSSLPRLGLRDVGAATKMLQSQGIGGRSTGTMEIYWLKFSGVITAHNAGQIEGAAANSRHYGTGNASDNYSLAKGKVGGGRI
jgi:hypothetical protein